MDTKTRNIRYLFLEVAFFGVLSGVVGAFLNVFALRLGATNEQIGLLSALPALISMLWLIPSGRFLERYTDILRPTLIFGFWQRLPYAVVALVVVLPAAIQVPSLILVVTLGAMAAATGSTAFTVMFGKVVPEGDRPRVVSTRNILLALVSAAAAVIGGKVLESIAFPWNYSLVFMVGFGFTLISLYCVSRIVVAPIKAAASLAGQSLTPRRLLSQVRQHRRFTRYTVGTLIANWGIYLPIPLYPLYYVRVLNMNEGWIGLITTIGWLIPILAYPLWARAAERFGNRPVMLVGLLGMALFPLTTALAPTQQWLLAPAIIGGIFAPAWNLAFFNSLYEVLPSTEQATYVSINTASVNLAAFVAPLVSAIILVPLIGIGPALIVGAVFRALGGVAMWVFTEKRTVSEQVITARQ